MILAGVALAGCGANGPSDPSCPATPPLTGTACTPSFTYCEYGPHSATQCGSPIVSCTPPADGGTSTWQPFVCRGGPLAPPDFDA